MQWQTDDDDDDDDADSISGSRSQSSTNVVCDALNELQLVFKLPTNT